MPSMWQDLALQWLGGEASEALTSDTSFLDRFPLAADSASPAILVARVDRVSHTALLHAAADPAQPLPVT